MRVGPSGHSWARRVFDRNDHIDRTEVCPTGETMAATVTERSGQTSPRPESPSRSPGATVNGSNPEPRVSVVIAAHTRVRYLDRAVRSAVAQRPDEVLVVKFGRDAVLDGDLRAVGAQVSITEEPFQGGKLAEGIDRATGDVVAFLDDDDILLPGKIARLREVFRDSQIVLHGHRYQSFDDAPPDRGALGPLHLFDTARGNQYWGGLKPVVASCLTIRRSTFLPWLSDLRPRTVADHILFMMAVASRQRIAMDESVLTGYHLVHAGTRARSATTLWQHSASTAEGDIRWMLDLVESESGGIRKTLAPIAVSAILHLVFLSEDVRFHEYARLMRSLLDGVGVRRPMTVPSILMFGFPLSPRLAIASYRAWSSLVGEAHSPGEVR